MFDYAFTGKVFPQLEGEELQVYDCDSSALEHISLWLQLRCLGLGGKTSYWNDNFDQVLIGFTEEKMHQWIAGGNDEVNANSLMAVKSLMRLYLTGGGQKFQEESNVLLSPLVMSCLLTNLPNLALRVLPGYNGSVLSHLAPFENANETLWSPAYPRDVEALFCT